MPTSAVHSVAATTIPGPLSHQEPTSSKSLPKSCIIPSSTGNFKLELRRFPVELRQMIFAPCLEFATYDTHGQFVKQETPALLAALRGDCVMYREALELFRKQNNTFVLHKGNDWSIDQIPQHLLCDVRKVEIILAAAYRHWTCLPTDPVWHIVSKPQPIDLHVAVGRAVNIREVKLRCSDGDEFFYGHFERYLTGFPQMTRLTIEFVIPPRVRIEYWEELLDLHVERANEVLGVKGRLETVREKEVHFGRWAEPSVEERTWVWEAADGTFLNEIEVEDWL